MTAAQHGDDPRWDNRVPWYLRHSGAAVSGSVDLWLDLVGQRVERLFAFNELGVQNEGHFGSSLETETLGRFKFTWGTALGVQLRAYLRPDAVRQQAQSDALGDPEEHQASQLRRRQRRGPSSPGFTPETGNEAFRAEVEAERTRPTRIERHWVARVRERIAALEAIMRLGALYGRDGGGWLAALVADLRRISAATHVPLDIRGSPPLIYPLEEPLLQREVIEPLLGRLSARWPDRAKELVTAYHDAMAGKPLDEVFLNAFKSVEEIARAITGDSKFDFAEADVKRYFPALHATTRAVIVKLRAHRGDAAAHGRKAPHPSEIRFLLFQLCNLALLLLDTQPGD